VYTAMYDYRSVRPHRQPSFGGGGRARPGRPVSVLSLCLSAEPARAGRYAFWGATHETGQRCSNGVAQATCLRPPSWQMRRTVPKLVLCSPPAASPCIRVRTTSSGCTHALTSMPDSEPTMAQHNRFRCLLLRTLRRSLGSNCRWLWKEVVETAGLLLNLCWENCRAFGGYLTVRRQPCLALQVLHSGHQAVPFCYFVVLRRINCRVERHVMHLHRSPTKHSSREDATFASPVNVTVFVYYDSWMLCGGHFGDMEMRRG
jgi:hypothetical protein